MTTSPLPVARPSLELSSELLLAGDLHIVGMALAEAGSGDTGQAGGRPQLLEIGGPGVAHACPQTTGHLAR